LKITRNKPTINVFVSFGLENNHRLNQLLYGIEEEQIPYFTKKMDIRSALELSYSAAKGSGLSVGIGVGTDQSVILHYGKLEKDNPIFQIRSNESAHKLRALGANAARLVKGMPFKELNEKEAASMANETTFSPSKHEQNDASFQNGVSNEAMDKEQIKYVIERVLSEENHGGEV